MDFDALFHILIFVIGGFSAFLFWRWRVLEAETMKLGEKIGTIQFNYMDRFDELKTLLAGIELKVIERISILETKICKGRENGR